MKPEQNIDWGAKISVENDDVIQRRVPIQPQHIRDDGTLTSAAFKMKKKDKDGNPVDGISIDIEKLKDQNSQDIDASRFRLYGLLAKEIRGIGLEVIHKPAQEFNNFAHGLIIHKNGEYNFISDSFAKKLSDLARRIQ